MAKKNVVGANHDSPAAGVDAAEWQTWQGWSRGKGARPGRNVSFSPGGAITISRELTDLMDKKRPYAMVSYSVIHKAVRIRQQNEITAGSLRWLPRKGPAGRLSAKAALTLWGLLPSCVTIYQAGWLQDGDGPFIQVDLTQVEGTIKMRKPAKRKGRDEFDNES